MAVPYAAEAWDYSLSSTIDPDSGKRQRAVSGNAVDHSAIMAVPYAAEAWDYSLSSTIDPDRQILSAKDF